MKWTVWVGKGEGRSEWLFLEGKASLVVGREDVDLATSDPYCSRHHAILYRGTCGELRVRDLSSCNGTFIGATRVVDTAVTAGDTIRVGRTLLRVSAQDGFGPGAPGE